MIQTLIKTFILFGIFVGIAQALEFTSLRILQVACIIAAGVSGAVGMSLYLRQVDDYDNAINGGNDAKG